MPVQRETREAIAFGLGSPKDLDDIVLTKAANRPALCRAQHEQSQELQSQELNFSAPTWDPSKWPCWGAFTSPLVQELRHDKWNSLGRKKI